MIHSGGLPCVGQQAVVVWWELEVRQMLGVVLWSVSEALRAAGQKSSAIHQSVTTAPLIANA